MTAPPPGSVGDVLRTVLFGPPMGDHLVLWHDDGAVTYWRVVQAPPLRERIGYGAVARSEVAERRFRECGLFNPDTSVLFLPDRYGGADGQVGGVPVQLEAVPADAARAAANQDDPAGFYRWIGDVVLAAARRGEFVAVETGGWEVPFSPYVLMMAAHGPDGGWYSHVETAPVPGGAPIWRDRPPPADATSQVLSSRAAPDTIAVAGHLAGAAMTTWEAHPFELGLSFGPSPFGPWPG